MRLVPANARFEPRPRRAWGLWLGILLALCGLLAFSPATAASHARAKAASPAKAAAIAPFQLFIEALWPQAQARGISRQTFDLAFKGVTYDPRVVAHTNAQAEFVKPIWQYLASAVTSRRIEQGEGVAHEYESWLAKAHAQFGVESSVVVGIWGLETDFGGFAGSDNVIRALASLAYAHYRGD